MIDPAPSSGHVLNAMRSFDYLVLSTFTFSSWCFRYIMGKPLRGPTAASAAGIGFTGGVAYAYQNSAKRLMGKKENAKEVEKYGLWAEKLNKAKE